MNYFSIINQAKTFLEQKSSNNTTETTLFLLRDLKVPVTTSSAIDLIEQHPDFPSLLSISDSLDKWKINNIALKVTADKLEKLSTPFVAHTKAGGGKFILVNNVNGHVEYTNEKGKRKQKTKDEFVSEWDNIVLLAERNENSGEKNYSANYRKELMNAARIPAIILLCFVLIILYSVNSISTASEASLLFLKLSGSVITGLLLWFEVDKSNPALKKICSAGKNTNCTAVLNSKEARLFNLLSWSEIGFFYFAGGFLFLLETANFPSSTLALLSWLNLFALPYIVFSVLYQWRIARQWCRLCLTVQALFLIEFMISYFGYWNSYQPAILSDNQLIPLFTSFLLPVFFWMATKRIYLNAQNSKRFKKELTKLKYNKEIFNALLTKQKAVTIPPNDLGITLGNPNAKHTIIKVCNPYCGPCAKAHPVIDEILENNEDVKVQILFTATNNENDKKAMPVKHLMALYEKNDSVLIKKALDDWYTADKKDYAEFAQKYSLNGELQMQGEKLAAMDEWCNKTAISFTPTFFVNGNQLPEMYKIEDLNYLLT